MKIEYEIKGIKLTEWDMYDIKKYYEAACTAEYIMENYDVTEEEAMELGHEVRRIMTKYGGEEEDVIYQVMNERDDEDDDNDFLQDLLDNDETEEFIECWVDQLLEATGKPNADELTAEEIRAEIDDIRGTISNESIVLGISEFAEKNIEHYEAYLERLEEMLKNREE